MYEIEGVISTWDSCLHLLNRSIPFIPKMGILLKPIEQRFIKVGIPFIDETSGLAMIKFPDVKTGCNYMIKI